MSLPISKIKIEGVKRIIGVVSGKGGVGKTFVAANLAAALAKTGKKVGILDANISCPNIFKVLGITARLTPTAQNKIFPIEKYGIKAVSMAGLCASEDEPIAWRGPIISKIIQQFLKESIWGELDVLIVDFPPGTSDAVLTVLQSFEVDGVIAVTMPQALSTMDARKTINAVRVLKVPVLGIIENMRGDIFGEGGGNRLADITRSSLFGSIPLRKQIVAYCDQGMLAINELEEIGMIFSRIARAVLEKIQVEA